MAEMSRPESNENVFPGEPGWTTRVSRAVRKRGAQNSKILFGLLLLLGLLAFSLIGPLFIPVERAAPMSVMPDMPPTVGFLLGSDSAGRDLFAVMMLAVPATLKIGLLAGGIGLVIGAILGFASGYLGGFTDTVIRSAADIGLTIPGLLVLVVIAATIPRVMSVEIISLIVASLAWMWPTRTIRSQVLSLREQSYVQMAKLNGMNTPQIIVRELLPNLLPYLAASFVGAVSSAVLAAIGLEALGLGPQNEPTLGMTIYWAIYYAAILRGLWWWWAAPTVAIVTLFVGLFLLSAGLDEVANPRLRRRAT